MSVKNQWKLLVGGLGARRPATSAARSPAREFLERSRLVSTLIFLVTVTAIVLISSTGMTSLRLPVLPGQTATVRVVAAAPFSYVSEEKTRAAREQFLDRVPPIYRLEFDALREFDGKTLQSVASDKIELDEAVTDGDALSESDTTKLCEWLKEKLGSRVESVRTGKRLVVIGSGPAGLAAGRSGQVRGGGPGSHPAPPVRGCRLRP